MTVLDAGLELSDAQALASQASGASVKSTNVIDMGTGQLDGWDNSKAPELGGSNWNVTANVALVGANATVVCTLVTNASAVITSGSTTIASVTFAAAAVAGTRKKVKLPIGTETLRYVGALYTVASTGGALTSGTFDNYLNLDSEVPG